MTIENTRKNNSVYVELKERLCVQKMVEMQSAYRFYGYDELDENLELIEDSYDINLYKLDEVVALKNQSEEVQIKFINQKQYIENKQIPEKSKLENILTTACILNCCSELVINLSENELFILSIFSLNIGSKYGIDSDYKEIINKGINYVLPYFRETQVSERQYTLK